MPRKEFKTFNHKHYLLNYKNRPFLNFNFVISLVLLLLTSPIVKPQITNSIYPEKLNTIDEISLTDSANIFLYEAGFPEASGGSVGKIGERRQGIVFNANSSFSGPLVTDTVTYSNNNLVAQGYAQTKNSQLDKLNLMTVSSSNTNGRVVINFKFINGAQVSYTYDCTYRIYNTGGAGNLVFLGYDNALNTFSSDLTAATAYPVPAGEMFTLEFSVTQLPAASGNQVKITYNGNSRNVGIGRNPTTQLELAVGVTGASANSIYIGAYWVLLNINGTSVYTISGSTNCSASIGCLEGYTCIGTKCLPCHGSCRTCTIQINTTNDSSSCESCQRNTKQWLTGPVANKCDLEYVDLSQYADISIEFEPPRTDRVTIGMWTFVEDMTNFNVGSPNNPVVNVSLSDFMVLSYYSSSPTDMAVVCTIFEKTKPQLKGQTTANGVSTAYNNSGQDSLNITVTNTGGKWFYTRCAMSLYSDGFYLKGKQGSNDSLSTSNVDYENIWTDIETNVHFQNIYRTGEKSTFEIRNASLANTKYYIKNLYVMRDFMDDDIEFQYWNLQKDASSTNLPFMLFSIGFDEISENDITYYIYQAYSGISNNTLTLTPSGTVDYAPPDNFRRLATHSSFNICYSGTNDLETTSALSVGTGQLHVFDDDKAFVCSSNYYLNLLASSDPNRFTCAADCPTDTRSYTIYPMLSNIKGQCRYRCSATTDCPNSNTKLQDILTYYQCTTGFEAFYKCVDDNPPRPYALYFSSFYKSESILFTDFESNRIDSYIMEIWWMRDNKFDNADILIAPTPNQKNYIFFSNTLRLYQHGTSLNYIVETPDTDLTNAATYANINAIINVAEWNKLIFNVSYSDPTYTYEFYGRNRISTAYSVGSTNTIDQHLQLIAFCHNDDNCESNDTVFWHSGYYKNLRVWNGDLASPWVVSQYDSYWASNSYRSLGIVAHWTFDLKQMRDNIFRDILDSSNNVDYSNNGNGPSWNEDNIAIFHYNNMFDYVLSKPANGQYVNSVTNGAANVPANTASLGACQNGICKRCFNSGNTNCYECESNYFLTESTCRANSVGNYYFSMPPSPVSSYATAVDVTFRAFDNVYPIGTVTFWVKTFGFFVNIGDMIEYGSNLKLTYDSRENLGLSPTKLVNNNYGLNLFYNSSGTNTQMANIIDYRDYFGRWVFMSLAYSYDASTTTFYPAMMKFEMNNLSFPINSAVSKANLYITNFKISKDFIGLVTKIKGYSKYIIGAFGVETNSSYTGPTPNALDKFLTPGSNTTNCLATNSPTTISYSQTSVCKLDYDLYFDAARICTTNMRYFDYNNNPCGAGQTCPNKDAAWGGTQACSTGCTGNIKNTTNLLIESCFCQHDDSKITSMIFKNNDSNICYRNDYVNFARTQQMTLTGVLTAKNTQRYTMQFWIWAYNYTGTTWNGITFEWNYHNKISIINNSGTYRYKCSPFYVEGSTSYENSVNNNIAFYMQEWNFISCAVDAKDDKYYYMLTETNSYNANFSVSQPPLTSISTTTLRITDSSPQKEWGNLFLRQIRLWDDAYISSGFLSRVEILTPALFGNLLNLWDPILSTANQLVDVTGNSPTQTVSYYTMPTAGGTNRIGMNVVDETFYSLLFLCSEDAQYYDSSTGTCVNFVNLVMLEEFKFTSIPVSYKGNYSMEFWIFNEDYKDITNGVNIIYEKHLAISVLLTASNTLGASCFPQAYYNDIDGLVGTNIDNAYSNALNKYRIDLTSTTGEWSWVRCAVSNYDEYFYMNDSSMQTITAETLYDATLNVYPYRYFFYSGDTVDVKVQGISSHTKKIYLRYLYVFNDFLPQNYKFNYMDLTVIALDTMPNLLLAVNFDDYNLTTNNLNYVVFNYGNPITYSVVNATPVAGATFALAANFVPLPLCNPLSNQKYDSTSNECISITSCTKPALNCTYCVDEAKPLQCLNNNYLSAPNATTHTCSTQCETGVTRSPGTINSRALCNYECDNTSNCPRSSFAQISDFPSNYLCSSGYRRINYKCIPESQIANSAVYYSSCFNTPNIFHTFSTTSTQKLLGGHILEFWFKVDTVNNSCNSSKTTGKEYYFYSKPHAFYRDYSDSQFYYDITTYGSNQGSLPSVQLYEWNIILIKTEINSTNREINVYINYNFSSPEYTKSSIPGANNIAFTSWSFCSDSTKNTAECDSLTNISWGSAYYRNVRVWDVTSATVQLAQAYANGLYSETLKSLINYYPLTVEYTDLNIFTNVVANYDHFTYSTKYKTLNDVQYNKDEDALYNWSTNFDWGVDNPKYYISSMSSSVISYGTCSSACTRCYSANTASACYECESGYVGSEQKCINVTGYYFKTPVTTPNSPVSLKIADSPTYDITAETAITMTFWMKFFGIDRTSVSSKPSILSINSNTFIGFDTSTNYLILNNNNKNVFTDSSFNDYIGIWIPILLANYKANSISYYYPNMLTLSVNRNDIPMTTGYSIPSSGISITEVKLGYEAVALFANFRFYSHFIQGSYGQIMSTLTNRPLNMIKSISLIGTSTANCIANSDLSGSTTTALGTECVGDYNIYLDSTLQCDDNKKYFDPALIAISPPCASCDNTCSTLCFLDTNEDCTCDLTVGQFWLRRKDPSLQAYCDKITNIDFSSYDPVTIPDLKGSTTEELTLEFWVYVYIYKADNVVFSSLDVYWNQHTRVKVYNNSNSLYMKCYSMGDIDDSSYTESITEVINYYKWNIVRCGVDRRNSNFFLNSVQNSVETADLPVLPETTSLKIGMMEDSSFTNFGFIFVREIKLWKQYNFNYVDTSYISITPSIYPGLLHLFPNDVNNSTIYEETNFNLISLQRRTDFIGYNFVDPTNLDLYSNLVLCTEGNVYDETKLTCTTPTSTKCLYPGDTNDACIACPNSAEFLNPSDGTCVSECPPYSFGNEDMNQCRPCDSTCYTCNGFTNTTCLSCTGDLYFNPNLFACVENCEFYALTASLTKANLCTLFDAIAVLVNYSEDDMINPSNFTEITAAVTKATADGWTVQWSLDFNKTKEINNDTVTLDEAGPFSGSPPSDQLTAGVLPSFFEAGKKYVFTLDIIRKNGDYSVSVSVSWTLTMNNPPQGGAITVTPDVGYRITTYFLMTCNGWTSNLDFPLSYRFYSREINTNIINYLTDWMDVTYTMSNFTVRYYQLEYSTIQVTCEAKDGYDMISEASYNITIVNTPESDLYNLTRVLKNYTYSDTLDQDQIEQRSTYLYSLGVNIYKDVQVEIERVVISNALDYSSFEVEEPTCISNYCNYRGDCFTKIDIYIYCNCNTGYTGKYCQVDKVGYTSLVAAYQNLFNVILYSVSEEITDQQLTAIHNLILGASQFHQDRSFFTSNLGTWTDLVKSNFVSNILDNQKKYFDMYDAMFTHSKDLLIEAKFNYKNSTNYPLRNISLLTDSQSQFETYSGENRKYIESLVKFIITQYGTTTHDIVYESDNFYVASTLVTPTFNATAFFKDRITNYRSYTNFMDCIDYIMIEKLSNPYYSIWFVFIEYKDYPYSYDLTYYQDSISPYVSLFFIDATTNKAIAVEGCTDKPIKLYMPYNSVEWVSQVNSQLDLYDPANYLSPDSPIFKSPIFINSTGYVSGDTIEERIAQYARNYNFSCSYYDTDNSNFNTTGLEYADLDSKNFIICNSTHSTDFNTFIIPNTVTYSVDGPFFYLKYPQVFTYWPNYTGNLAFFVIIFLLSFYILMVLFTSLWDWKNYRQEVLLEFLKYNIVKVQMPYNQNVTFNPNKIFPIDDFIGYDTKNPHDDGVNVEDRFGKDEDAVDSVFRPRIGGKELGVNTATIKKKDYENKQGSGPFGLDFGVEDEHNYQYGSKSKGDRLPLFNDDVFNIEEDPNKNDNEFNEKQITNNPFISDTDKDVVKNFRNNKIEFGEVNVDHLQRKDKDVVADDFEDEESETEARLSAFAALPLGTCEFFCWNIKARHVLISPLINSSLFNPRYKKLTCLITELSIPMLLLAVLLTVDQTVLISLDTTPTVMNNMAGLIGYALLATLASNIVLYFLVWFFLMSTEQRKVLFKTVKRGIQMRILRIWNEIEKKNCFFTFFGMLLNFIFIFGSFYFSFNYVAVWTAWDVTWLIALFVSYFIDLIILEIGFEFFIACLFHYRTGSPTVNKLAEFLNRMRSYRTMWP